MTPTPEDGPFPIQTSLYAASKVAGEGMIGAYAHGFGFTGLIFRFVSVLGERYTHGHVIDFYRALKADPSRLHVLGDGRQTKSYLYVQDCVDGDPHRHRPPRRRPRRPHLQPGHRRDRHRRRLDRDDHRPDGRDAARSRRPAATAAGPATPP